jgi:RNA polymerase sigma factor (sigma-70 family)
MSAYLTGQSTPTLYVPTPSPLHFTRQASALQGVATEQDLVRAALLLRYRQSLAEEDADEILSMALQKVWQSRQSFDPAKASLRTWFYCIAQRVALDRFKHGWHQSRQREVPWQSLAEIPALGHEENEAVETAPEAAVSPSELQTALAAAVASLPKAQQHIVWADALGAGQSGITSEQLGEELGIPAGTVRVYRKRALEKLRQLLAPLFQNS